MKYSPKPITHRVEVRVFYIKTLNKKTNKQESIRVTQRKLYISDPNAFLDSGEYRIFVRKGSYTLSAIPRIKHPWWMNPSGEAKTWYTTNFAAGYVRTDDKAMNEVQILHWLSVRMGKKRASEVLEELLTSKPS